MDLEAQQKEKSDSPTPLDRFNGTQPLVLETSIVSPDEAAAARILNDYITALSVITNNGLKKLGEPTIKKNG